MPLPPTPKMSMKIACALITHLPLKAEMKRHAELRDGPAIVFVDSGRGPHVLDCSPEVGIAAGMPLQEAVSRCKEAVLIEADRPYYHTVFDRIVDSLLQRSPLVERAELGCAYVGVHGLEDIYGDEARVMTALLNGMPDGYGPRIGLAGTKYPAYVAAVMGREGQVTRVPEDVACFLKDVTVDLLPIRWDSRARLHGFGLHTMGQVASLHVGSLQAQLGPEGRLAWELSNGIDGSRLNAVRQEEVVSESVTFPSPVTTLSAVLPAAEMLLGRAFAHPAVRGRYVRAIFIEGRLMNRPPWRKTFAFKTPVGARDKALSTIESWLETVQLPGPLEDLSLTISGVTGDSGMQSSLLPDVRKREQLRETMRQLETRLRTKPPVYRVVELEPWSRIPERRLALVQFEP